MKNLYIILFTFIFSQSFGQVIFKEGFKYTENSLLTANGWTAHSGGGTNTIKVSSGLSQGTLSVEGGSAILTTSGEDINRQITNQVSTGSVYTRFLLNVTAAQDAGDYFFHLGPKDLGTIFRGKVFVKKSGVGFQIGVTKASNIPNYGATVYDLNTTIIVVMKYTFKTTSTTDDEVVLYVNPTIDKEPTTALSTTPAGETDLENIGSVALRQGAAANAPNVKVDEIVVGTTWNDVFSVSNSADISLKNLPQMLNKISNQLPNSYKIDITGSNLEGDLEILPENEKNFEVSKDDKNWEIMISYKIQNKQINDAFYVRVSDKLNNIQFGKQNLVVRYGATSNYKVLTTAPLNFQITETILGFTKVSIIKTIAEQTTVKAAGRVTGEVNSLLYIQDESGGIPVSGTFANLKLGDSVQVSGKLSNISKQLVIQATDFTKIGTTNKILLPKTITSAQLSANEGNLISVQNINFSDKKFVFLPNTNYTISDGTNASTVRVWETTDIDGLTKPQGNIAITGIVGRFNDGFQIYPRFKADIPTAAALPKTNSTISLDKTLDVAAWNVYWFGNKANGATDEALQQTNVKRVLDSLKADLYVLSEVSNPTAFTDLVAKMIGFKGLCSTAISAGGVADDAQRVCFIYKESVITAISSKPLLKGTTPIANYPDTFDRFWASGRLPFLFVCDANVDGVKRRLNVVGIHARANTASDIPNSERIFQQRKIDVEVLKDSLDKQFKDELVMIAGDFNDDVDENVVAGISTKESSYKKFVDDTENWQAITKTLSDNGYRTYIGEDNVIDHILISNKLKTSYLQNSVRVELPFMYLNNYRNTTSDHIPVMARFQLQALPLATEENVKNFGKIYPNPSNGNIEFDIDDAFKSQSFTYTFSDQVGQVFYSEKGNWSEVKGKMNEALKGKATGIYFLKIADEKKKQVFKVLIEK